MSQGAVA